MQAVEYLRPVPNPPEELETLFREHHDQVFRTAYRVTGSAVDAEDVLQTVFLRIMRQENRNLSPSPGSYLHRAAINTSLDLMRSRSRSRSVSIEDADFELIEARALIPKLCTSIVSSGERFGYQFPVWVIGLPKSASSDISKATTTAKSQRCLAPLPWWSASPCIAPVQDCARR